MTAAGPDLAGSRRRHPAGGPLGAPVEQSARAVAGALARRGAPHPAVGAAALAVRGTDGRSRSAFAAALGLGAADLVAYEAGLHPLADLPAPLCQLTAVIALERALRGPVPGGEYGRRTDRWKGM